MRPEAAGGLAEGVRRRRRIGGCDCAKVVPGPPAAGGDRSAREPCLRPGPLDGILKAGRHAHKEAHQCQ
ncbi:hypothetical protein MANAM107_08100 [Actinomyces capricornis]|uniref:Uncharacterized protein n=1 Tax=Actinomyces capricornis TaxID=2755559 RepID=A0ABM7U993_9ACTO|nr:hypothetical protein MANAM107_08100 [Actinomyces capricornis]